ncbi:bifunctional DNA primase/polymerase [Microbacterium sp. ZXX196]|uniref:bifunctional DNA primase/polymerase n=1 Tax=Microbacterium sp. ZXX196 TaxID=2609291 RepID=UPI001E4FCF97|nr:bifunctional DNA primase/polymerase [Microbacterium sp. ZXX196]
MKAPGYVHGPGDPPGNPALAAALEWAARGWPVFPLRPGGKTPAIPSAHKGESGPKCDGRCGKLGHGVLDATRDPEKLARLFGPYPTANVGGATTGRLVIDLDYQHGVSRSDALPETRTHLSGRGNGNEHLVYRVGGGFDRPLTQGHIVHGVDFKCGPGAYVVLPPSLHPDTGQPYTVADDSVPERPMTVDEVRAVWVSYGAPMPGERKPHSEAPGRPSLDAGAAGGLFARSEAVHLILNPPSRGEGVTNNSLTKVAGYYARLYRDDRELFDHHVDAWIAEVDASYEDRDTVRESIWVTEQSHESDRERRIEEQVEHLRIRGAAERIYREERRRDSEEAGHLAEGGEFVLDIPEATAVWGDGAAIGWNSGEALILAGPNGVGKSTLAAQLVRARLAGGRVLGLPVAATASKVLYLAMDRPMQIRRLLNKYLGSIGREVLDQRLVVWKGPPPADLAAHPETLLELAQQAGADTVVVDSLKDAAVGLSSDEVGAAYNRARQIALNGGVEVLELHHMVKKGENGSKPDRLEDVYGSIWITAGAGSVVLLWGTAGDTLVELTHLKQPIDPLGPWQVFHDRERAVSRVYRKRDALAVLCALSDGGLTTANAVAAGLFDSEKPDEGEKQKVRRKLESFEARGWAKRHPGAVKVQGQKPSDGWEATDAGRKRADEDAFDDSVGGDGDALFGGF